jgi:hypothetical protein
MNSLLEKEGMAGKVQMVYIDPPYGISYRSNFQPFVNKRNVKEGDKDEDLTAEPVGFFKPRNNVLNSSCATMRSDSRFAPSPAYVSGGTRR